MRSIAFISFAPVVASASHTWAKDRPVTDQERPKIEVAVKAAGCSGGRMQFDEDKGGQFELHDTMCGGKRFELVLDRAFRALKKKPS